MSSEQLNSLVERHCDTIGDMFTEFQDLYLDRQAGAPPSPEAMGVLHKLKGSSGSIGFTRVNKAVTTFEKLLKEWPDVEESGQQYDATLNRVLETLKEIIDRTTPEDSTLYGRAL